MNFKKLNNITGWVVWAIASFVYLSTIEPTASFWDCGEFIASSYKLEVGHPPGAPLFMLLGRLFSMFVSPDKAAMMINVLSALASSFTILFLFWTITLFGKKIVLKNKEELSDANVIAILGSGIVGALAYTFSDSFWFSAVEAEVYALSSLFTALVFWAMLKWDEVADQPYANRWLILIAYLMGLSIGVHLLNLLAIPSLVFIYYFRKYEVNKKGIIQASIIAVLLLGVIQYGIIPYTVKIASWFELLFVNTFGLPFNSGVLFYILLLAAGLVYGIYWTRKNDKKLAHIILMGVTVILIGYSSFTIIVIRSLADPPMDENNPENVFNLLSYLNREQYGDRPLFYGHYFNSPLDNEKPYKDGKPTYYQDKKSGKYIITDDGKNSVPNYAKEFCSIFPRMYSSEGRHVRAYKQWSKFKGKPIRYQTITGEIKTINKPTMIENLRFFFSYQLGWMYWRYFMWNFAGRQNDIQGHGNVVEGNWISGIKFLDEMRLGKQDNLPDYIADNPGNNKYYLLPFLLGLIGLFFQFSKDRNSGIIVALLFFFTGIAIVIYLNQYPYQPRERDYAYVGSFYAFAIWIGLGVMSIYDALRKKTAGKIAAVLATVLGLIVPGIMAAENWDDHDRSNTYTARDFAKNYLDSCAPNAILFTNGDNDTFPLWYVQEVEGYRTDVRVINLSLLNTDWYIDQMRRKAYESEPVPFTMKPEQYRQGTRDYLPVIDKNKSGKHIDIKKIIQFITDEKNKIQVSSTRSMNFYPTNKFSLKVDSAKVVSNGTIPPDRIDRMVDEIKWQVNKNYILKNDMMVLDLLAGFNWDRPIYFAITTGDDAYVGLQDYFQLEGLTYRLVPYKAQSTDGQTGEVHSDIMYDNLMNKFHWGGMDKYDIYLNENNRRMCMNIRNNFARLAEKLILEGKKEKALKVLDKCVEVLPERNVPYDFFMLPIAEAYYKCGATEKANEIIRKLSEKYERELNYYFSLEDEYRSVKNNAQRAMSILYRLVNVTQQFKQDSLHKEIQTVFDRLQQLYAAKEGMVSG